MVATYVPGPHGPMVFSSTAGGGGSVTVDVVGTTKYQATSNNFNYTGITPNAVTGLGLVCALIRSHASNDVTAGVAVTWNGVPLALRKMQDAGVSTSAVFLFGLHNPASGAQTLNVQGANIATDNFVNCVSFSNVNQTSDALAFPNPTGTNNAVSIAVTSASGHAAVGVGFNGSNNGTIIGTTIISDATSGALVNALADYVISSGASTTVGTTTSQISIAGMDVSN